MEKQQGKDISRKILNIFCFYMLLAGMLFPVTNSFAQNTRSASLSFNKLPAQIKEGERITVSVKVNSSVQSINAISGIISFPTTLTHVVSLDKRKSIINLWTQEPRIISNRIIFEGIILNPGFQGSGGEIFQITFEARKTGTVTLSFTEGAILANDGLGTNILSNLLSTSFKIVPGPTYFTDKPIVKEPQPEPPIERLALVPFITKYFPVVNNEEAVYLRGKGEPNALTKIIFQNTSFKSVGEKLIAIAQNDKKELTEVVVKNDASGNFQYISSANLVAGAYNATPFLVDTVNKKEIPGPSIQLLVNDSELVKKTVVILNLLALFVPIVSLIVIIWFIPWYSWRKSRLMKGKMQIEEEKNELIKEDLKNRIPIP